MSRTSTPGATEWAVPSLPVDLVPRRLAYTPGEGLSRSFSAATAAFRAGTDTPTAFLERCLAAIAQHEPSVRAFVRHDFVAARTAAAAATRRWASGTTLSPIDGMPVAVKDMIETADFPTEMNSPIYQGWHSRRDAAAVLALRQAGAVVLGKTVTTEFAVGNSGPTRNPYDTERTPGGSSSGSAAAVGAGMVSLALGTQTQASTIRPAGYCGAWGFKPSHDALNTGGVTPLALSQDHLGIIAASRADAWAGAMAIAAGVGGNAPHPGLQGPADAPASRRPEVLVRLDMQGWAETPQDSCASFESALARIASAGVRILDRHADVEVAALEAELADANDYSYDILAWEARWPLRTYLAGHGASMVGGRIQHLLRHAAGMDAASYQRALGRRAALRVKVEALRARADGFLALSCSGPAVRDHAFTGSRSYPLPWTMVAAPAFSMPLLASEELPLGLQLCGFREHDASLCAIAGWIEDLLATPESQEI